LIRPLFFFISGCPRLLRRHGTRLNVTSASASLCNLWQTDLEKGCVIIMTVYDFSVRQNDGATVSLSEYRGKVLLIVNTASQCGFTPQLGPLEKLYEAYRDRGFVILAFPSNQFAGQEPGDDEHICHFYTTQYKVAFPIMAKIDVNGRGAIPLYKWLVRQKKGVLGRAIIWNFTKFLINRRGEVVSRCGPSVEPDNLKPEIEKLLAETVEPSSPADPAT
jgi:glutathione peroxidase